MRTELDYEPKQPAAEAEINRILKAVLAQAGDLLKQRSTGVEKIELALLERATLTGEAVRQLLEPWAADVTACCPSPGEAVPAAAC